MKLKFLKLLMPLALFMFATNLIAQNQISGKVTDASDNPLPGASVIIDGTKTGTTTDFDGNFTLSTNKNYPIKITVSYIGFKSKKMTISSSEKVVVTLRESENALDQIVISASRRQEKAQNAPASISVINSKGIEVSASSTISPIRNLISETGVQIQQQSAVRMNIEMRGQSVIFGTSVFPIKDYRSLVAPGVGQFDGHASGIMGIDTERIEVVRGPGSALYGPGVTSGVVHFITKSALKYPGTTVELIGGNMSTYGASVRHAGRNKDKTFGYKINFSHKKGNDFLLDGSEGTFDGAGNFTSQLDKLKNAIYQPNVVNGVVDATTTGTLIYDQNWLDADGDGILLEPDWFVSTADLTLEFKPTNHLKFTWVTGYNQNKSLFFNQQGEGLQQNAEFYTQARMQYKGLFVQAYYLNNDGGTQERPTFLYQTGNRTPVGRTQLEFQAQYNFDTPSFFDADWTAGFDYRKTTQNTEHLVYGRNEDDDDYLLTGAYLQGKLKLHEKLDLVIAGRFDSFNFINQTAISPRVSFVYKPAENHTFRASYNRSNTAPSNLNVNIDFPLATPVSGLFDVWLAGNGQEHLFGNNPMIDVTIPGVPDLPLATPGLPLAIPFGAVTADLLASLAGLVGTAFTQAEFDIISAQLTGGYAPSGFSGTFQSYNLLNGQPLSPIDAGKAQLNIYDTYEIGYKGIINDKLGVTLDVYLNKSKNFRAFTVISPTIKLVGEDTANLLGNAVGADIQPLLESAGIAPARAAQLAAILGGAYNSAGASFTTATSPLYGIFGAVETNLVPQGDNITHVAAGYRTFGKIQYVGVDLGLNYFLNDNVSLFANYSYLSQTEFQGADLGEAANSPLRYFLNTPKNKFRIGASYTPNNGLRGSLSFQHDSDFNADLGQYNGHVDAKNLLDLSVGYKTKNGYSFDLGATNLFDTKYRALVNMPEIGRTIMAKLTYQIDGK